MYSALLVRPLLSLSPSAACYHSCKKCSGPQDYKCLDCKPGWILHDNKCVGECGCYHFSSSTSHFQCSFVELFTLLFLSPLDTDECGTELARCPTNTYCHNTDGSYECRGDAHTLPASVCQACCQAAGFMKHDSGMACLHDMIDD